MSSVLIYLKNNKKFLIKLLIAILLTGGISLLTFNVLPNYLVIGVDEQEIKCFDATFYLIVKKFNSKKKYGCFYPINGQMQPYFNDNQLIFKEIIGRPGDILNVKERKFFINNTFVGEAKKNDRHGKTLKYFVFNGQITDKNYFVISSSEQAFDSRYIGFIKEDQFIGNAYPIF